MWEWFPDGSCEKPQFCKDLAWHKNPAYENGIDWIVMGGESGPGARPMHPYWARSMRDQCERARVPFFFKQYGEWVRCGMVEDETKYKCQIIDGTIMCRVGKKTAGHILDGIVHDYLPEILR